MGTSDFIIIFFLSLIGSGVFLYFAWALLSPASLLLRGGKGSFRLSRVANRLKRIDQLLDAEQFDLAIRELRRCVLVNISGSEKVLRELKSHHQNILSRCIVIAEQLGGKLDSLPDVERLLIERTQLLHLFDNTHQAFHKVTEKRVRAGKALPTWSKEEYRKRVKQVKSELKRNLGELEEAYEKLFSSITQKEGEQVTYH